MKYTLVLLNLLLLGSSIVYAQVGVDNTDPHPSSVLDLSSTDKGLLIPRMTSVQREAIASPANALLVFDTTLNRYFYYDDGQWSSLKGLWDAATSGSDIYYNSGNVGIGTTTPHAPLQFAGTAVKRKIVLFEAANNDHQYYGFGLDGNHLAYQSQSTTADHVWYAGTSATTSNELMRATGDGLLSVSGTGTFNSVYQLTLGAGNLRIGDSGTGGEIQTFSEKPLYVNPLGNNVIFNKDGGNVGIGGSGVVPLSKLQTSVPVNSESMTLGDGSNAAFAVLNSGGQYGLFMGVGGTGNTWMQSGRNDLNGSAYNIVMQGQGGSVGIGQVPSYDLDVFSTGHATINVTTNGIAQSGIRIARTINTPSNWELYTPSGNTDIRLYSGADRFIFSTAGVGTGTDWVATSDRRLKEDIKSIDGQLSKISAISSIARNYNRTDNGENETGFIAQELHKVAPEYVNIPDDSTQMWSVNYSKMVVPLYKAVSELNAEVELLKKEMAELKALLKR